MTMQKGAKMGVWTLSMILVAAVLSIVNFPEQAEFGCAIVFYLVASGLFFFIPIALVSAELAAAWPYEGGVYLWVREAFGPEWGFVTVSMQWLNSLPWFATVLTFIATALAFLIDPTLAKNRIFVYSVVVISMWLCTFLNFFGIRTYAKISSLGALFGTVIPSIAIILLAVWYFLSGHAPAIPVNASAFLPKFDNWGQIMLIAGMMVALAGIDMPAIHVTDTADPGKNFPRAIVIASVLIISLSILGSLSISLVVPPGKLSMASGAPEAFSVMFDAFGMPWAGPAMCVLLIAGALTTVVTWSLGPSKGLLEVAREGYLPVFWQYRNKHGAPTHILILQAIVPSVISLVIFFMPTIGGAFWVMMALSSQLYMLMYLLMFSAAIRLRYSQADKPRPYRVPGGNAGIIAVSLIGMATSLLSMICGFIPPASVRAKGTAYIVLYILFISAGTLFFVVGAILLIRRRVRLAKQAGRDLETL